MKKNTILSFPALRRESGVALTLVLLVMIILLVFSSMFFFRTLYEARTAQKERELTKTFYIAEGGANYGVDSLEDLINTDLLNTVNSTNPQLVSNKASNYVSQNNALGFLIEFVKKQGTPQFTLNGNEARYSGLTTTLGNGTFNYDIIVTPKGNPITVNVDQWDFPYYYRIESTGNVVGLSTRIFLSGDFTVRVQRDNFAKFALFTDHHRLPSGTIVWFTDKTNFAGPVHTNERLSFALNPSGIFGGLVSQQNNNARFYNAGSPLLADADSNPPYDVPTFNAGYNRSAAEIVLSSSVQQQDLSNQATGGQTITGNGIFVPNNGSSLTGGIFVRGNPTITMGVDGSGNATYDVTEGSTNKIITVDRTNNQTIVLQSGQPNQTYSGIPDGIDDLGTIVYVDGQVSALSGTVQRDTEVTISSQLDIIVSDHLRYENYTPAVGQPSDPNYVSPSAVGTTNLLGILSWGGDVRVGTSAPDNLDIHGVTMARNGIFTVDNYNNQSVGPRGTATLLGGAITQFYGAFGLFNGSTGQQISGYGRNFIYDSRTLMGKSPPYFPSLKTFIAFTNDLTDKIIWQEGT